MLKKGLVQVYTSTSEWFNFAPIGLSLRAAGQNLRTLNACFSPHKAMNGDAMASLFLKPNLVIDHTAIEEGGGRGMGRGSALDAFVHASAAALAGEFDIVILNGINPLLDQGVISLEQILRLIEKRPPNVELVLSGPGAPEEIIDRADLVTEMIVTRSGEGPEDTPGSEGRGTIEVVTGNGKGKTTYCLGKAMMMSCVGIRAAILQFMKSPQPYGEIKAIEKFPYLSVETMGKGFFHTNRPAEKEKHLKAARVAWEECLREIFSLKYGLVVLDEINTATYYGLVHHERVRELLFLKPRGLHLLLSGRKAHLEVRAAASTLIEMREIKHPYRKGIKARKGIEF